MRRQNGRLLELPILIVLALAGVVWLTSVVPILGASVMALISVVVIVLFVRRGLEVRRVRAACRAGLERTAAEHGLELSLRFEGESELHGGKLGLDPVRRKLVFADPQAGRVLDYARIGAVHIGTAHALGTTQPSWFSLELAVEGEKLPLGVATTSRRKVKRWLRIIGRELGEPAVRDALAGLE